MAMYEFNVSDLVQINWMPGETDRYRPSPLDKFTNEDTGVAIFSPYQEGQLNLFKENNEFQILYESPKAYNKSYPKSGPRNTLVIFERNENVPDTQHE